MDETFYRELADFTGRQPPAPKERIFAIRFEHDGWEYEARVGDPAPTRS